MRMMVILNLFEEVISEPYFVWVKCYCGQRTLMRHDYNDGCSKCNNYSITSSYLGAHGKLKVLCAWILYLQNFPGHFSQVILFG